MFDPSYEKNVEYQDVVFKEWKLSREDVQKYATIIYKDLKSNYVTLKHGDEEVVRVSIEGYPYLALWTHDSASDFLCIEPWYSHGDFEKETPDFYHREGTMVLNQMKSGLVHTGLRYFKKEKSFFFNKNLSF